MKTFEHFGFSDDRRRIVKRRVAKLSRFAVVLLIFAAWFSISNHCALGALIAAHTQSATMQMHCHGNQSLPSNKSGEEETPCCRVLHATVTGEAKILQDTSKDFLPIQSWIATELIFAETRFHRAPLELDTGPPFAVSFAESVLQRSIFAHAPPFVA